MVTLGQRINELRTAKGLSAAAVATALGMPKGAVEKFETGRQTPSKAQQEQLAGFFGVSLMYLRGESSDPTRMSNWMEELPAEPEPDEPKVQQKSKKPTKEPKPEGALLDSLLATDQVRDLLRQIVLETLRSPEGAALIKRIANSEK
ncbi:MAG: helix-turn-helix domain-containing protein [Christensenellales bacterium]|jgi:transcriptional regulator with XRE-family HTH domain